MRTTILSAATLGVAALALGQLAPASVAEEPATGARTTAAAGSLTVTDPADLHHGADLRKVRVQHKDRTIVVTTTHTNLRPDYRTGSSGAVYLDTDPSDPGPEYVFSGGYFDGTDYLLSSTDGFAVRTWEQPVDGSYRMWIDYDREKVRMRISRKALGSPDEVRVAVRVAGQRTDGSTTRKDWLGEPRSWTDWVAR